MPSMLGSIDLYKGIQLQSTVPATVSQLSRCLAATP